MDIDLIHPGDLAYDAFAREVQQEPLQTEWATDADSGHEDGVRYAVVYDLLEGVPRPAAWAGFVATRIDGRHGLKCCSNYIRRAFRDRPVRYYDFAFLYRQQLVIEARRLPAETWLFPEPIGLHEAAGWVKDTSGTGSGTTPSADGSGEIHHWQRMTWHPSL